MHKTIKNINQEYNDLLAKARKRLQRSRILHNGVKGRVQTTHLNANGVVVDLEMDDGRIVPNIKALEVTYDP